MSFVTTEGLDSVRMQTELLLAHGIQATLVPAISLQTAGFEVYGKSLPSAEMGGDLIDVIDSNGNLLVYIADVSGHGLGAGQLMGMLKTAMRVSFQFQPQPTALLESADRVLPAVKEADMYATLALLQFDGSAQAEYASAGHVPVLHYRDRTGDVASLWMQQFPLGLIPGGCYESQRVSFSSRDSVPDGHRRHIGSTQCPRRRIWFGALGAIADATLGRAFAGNLGTDHGACAPVRLATG
jgi:sigma-B regulation protein RsbU (phosphoserine phosphatase)